MTQPTNNWRIEGFGDSLENIVKWVGRVITIALGVFLGLLLFMWLIGYRLAEAERTPYPSYPAATVTYAPTPTP